MPKKVLLSGLAVVLVIAVVAGVVATKQSERDPKTELTTTSCIASALCTNADYKTTCESTLTTALNGSDSTEDAVRTTIRLVLDEFSSIATHVNDVVKGFRTEYHHAAMEDCKNLIESATDDLHAALAYAGDPKDMGDRVFDIGNWLSAVLSYSGSCVDAFHEDDIHDKMHNVFKSGVELASNALAVLKEVVKFLEEVPLQNLKLPTLQRRLLSQNNGWHRTTDEGFPEWLSVGDRKLLARSNNKKKKNKKSKSKGRKRGGIKKNHSGGNAPSVSPVNGLKPNIVVAQDGSGNFKSINEALKSIPNKSPQRFIVYIKAGKYYENVLLDNNKINVMFYGDGQTETVVIGKRVANFQKGPTTSQSATFAVEGPGFISRDMGFSNIAGPLGMPAVALRVKSDRSAFYRVRVDGHQDTLYVHSNRQLYRECVITGTIDFIFGDSMALIQNSLILPRRGSDTNKNMVTAQGRDQAQSLTALVIQNCRILPDQTLFAERFTMPTYLGRPWKSHSRTIIMESEIGDLIRPEGWHPWNDNNGPLVWPDLFIGEYNNRGPGANTDRRVRWKGFKVIRDRAEAMRWTAGTLLRGESPPYDWLSMAGVPFQVGLIY